MLRETGHNKNNMSQPNFTNLKPVTGTTGQPVFSKLTAGAIPTTPAPKLGLEDSLRAKGGYGNEMVADEVAGAKKIAGSIQQGVDSMRGTPLDFTQGKEYFKSFTPNKIANAVIGMGQAGAGAVSGVAETLFAPISPAVQSLVKSANIKTIFTDPELRAQHPETAKIADSISGKVNEISKNLDPRTIPLVMDLVNTALMAFVGGETKIGIPEVAKTAFTKEAAQGVVQGVKEDIIPAVKDVATKGIEKVGGAIENAATTLKDVATSGKNLSKAESALQDLKSSKEGLVAQKADLNAKNVAEDLKARKAEIPTEKNTLGIKEASIKQSITDIKSASKADVNEMAATFEKTNKTLQDTLTNEAKLATEQNKGTLKDLFKNMSETYKSGLAQAEKEMAARGAQPIKGGFSKVIDDTLETAKNYRIDANDPVIKALNKAKANLADGKPLTLDQMVVLKKEIYNASKMGDDFINDEFMRNYGKFLEDSAPELKALNQEFGPMADAKKWANRKFIPYTEAEITKGQSVLEKLATGEKPDQTTINYLKNLSEGSGRFKGAGDLTGGTTKAGENIKMTQKMYDDALDTLRTSTDRQLFNAETDLQRIGQKSADLETERVNLTKQIADQTSSHQAEKRALDKVIKDQDALIKQQTEVVKKLENMKKVRDSLVKGALSTFKWGTVIGGSIFGASKAYDILK